MVSISLQPGTAWTITFFKIHFVLLNRKWIFLEKNENKPIFKQPEYFFLLLIMQIHPKSCSTTLKRYLGIIDMTQMSPAIQLPQTESSSLPEPILGTLLSAWDFSPLPSSILLIIGVRFVRRFYTFGLVGLRNVDYFKFCITRLWRHATWSKRITLIACCKRNLTSLHHTAGNW